MMADYSEQGRHPFIRISRRTYTQAQFEAVHPRLPPDDTSICAALTRTSCRCSAQSVGQAVAKKLPVVGMLRGYHAKDWWLSELIAGLSIGAVHVPQGMGFAVLASLPPVYGLYTSMFPVLVYFLFGTSHHVSLGTMAITSLITGAVVEQHAKKFVDRSEFRNNSFLMNHTETVRDMSVDVVEQYKVGVASSLALLMGIWQVGFSLMNLGMIATFMSMTFVGGFMTGSAGHIITSQIPSVLGIKVEKATGTFSMPVMLYRICLQLPDTNIADLVTSIVCITILFTLKEVINVRYRHRLKAPIPAELIVAAVATIVSHFAQFSDLFNVKVIGIVPTGLPMPEVPGLEHAEEYLLDAFLLAILSFAFTISMAKIISRKHDYPIDQNQEMFAHGMAFFVSSFFQCFPGTQSPPRTLIQESAGGKTQVAGIFSSLLLLPVCLFIGPALQSLPMCVLSSIIIVALIPLLRHVADVKLLWHINRQDAAVWVITCLSTLIFSITIGLAVGVAVSLLTVVFSSLVVSVQRLGAMEEGLYMESATYKTPIDDVDATIAIVRAEGPLFFANVDRFKAAILKASGFGFNSPMDSSKCRESNQIGDMKNCSVAACENDQEEEPLSKELDTANVTSTKVQETAAGQTTAENNTAQSNSQQDLTKPSGILIINAAAMSYIDMQGLNALPQFKSDFASVGVRMVLAECPSSMLLKLEKTGYLESNSDDVFVTVEDAVQVLKQELG